MGDWLDVDEQIKVGISAAFEELEDEWDSSVCAICQNIKWAYYPFCRKCSIRLLRVNMMRPLQPFFGHTSSRISREPRVLSKWFRHYDRARDFLWATKVVPFRRSNPNED